MTGQKLYLTKKGKWKTVVNKPVNVLTSTSLRTALTACSFSTTFTSVSVNLSITNFNDDAVTLVERKCFFLLKKKTLTKLKSPLRLTGRPLNPFGTCRYFEKAKLCLKSVPVDCLFAQIRSFYCPTSLYHSAIVAQG